MMDEGRILIVNLQKGLVGEQTANLFAAFLISTLASTALSRVDIPPEARRPFYLYADEFGPYATTAIKLILTEARKYALGATLSTQYLGTMNVDLQEAVLANVATTLSLRLGPDDALPIARHLGLGSPDPAPHILTDLDNFKAYGKFLLTDNVSDALLIDLSPPPKPINHRPHRLITNSRLRFGCERAKIEARIAKFLLTDDGRTTT